MFRTPFNLTVWRVEICENMTGFSKSSLSKGPESCSLLKPGGHDSCSPPLLQHLPFHQSVNITRCSTCHHEAPAFWLVETNCPINLLKKLKQMQKVLWQDCKFYHSLALQRVWIRCACNSCRCWDISLNTGNVVQEWASMITVLRPPVEQRDWNKPLPLLGHTSLHMVLCLELAYVWDCQPIYTVYHCMVLLVTHWSTYILTDQISVFTTTKILTKNISDNKNK